MSLTIQSHWVILTRLVLRQGPETKRTRRLPEMAVSVLLFRRNFFYRTVLISWPFLPSFDDIDAIRDFTCKAKG
jgi:hypothetical protein